MINQIKMLRLHTLDQSHMSLITLPTGDFALTSSGGFRYPAAMNAVEGPQPDQAVRIALMCENPAVYRSLSSRLAADHGFQVVGMFDCLIEKVPEVLATRPDVTILGISHITHFNMLVCAALRQSNPAIQVVVLPSFANDAVELQMAYSAGASAVTLKNIDTPALVDQIHQLIDNPV